MPTKVILEEISGNCTDNHYCVLRDVLRSQGSIEFREHLDAGGCANNGGCNLKGLALDSGIPNRVFIEGSLIAKFAFENGIKERKEARKKWNAEGYAERFENLYGKLANYSGELYDAILGKNPDRYIS